MLDVKIRTEPKHEIIFRAKNAISSNSVTHLALIGSFTPRRCGIATFTADVYAALAQASQAVNIDVYAMTQAHATTHFDAPVFTTIIDNDFQSYCNAALSINTSAANVVWLQHEFGLFGGPAGDMILHLVDRIAAPLIITLHTVLAAPNSDQMRVMQRLIGRASKLVVMSHTSRSLLLSVYGADAGQIAVIEHGAPDRPFGRGAHYKQKYDLDGRQTLMTFGLISPGKGIETVILALPAIVEEFPDILYCIAGATHPNLVASEGEKYRESLKSLAVSLGVETHIHWVNEFLDMRNLLDLIEATDIYVTPYLDVAQSTSGTLSYALALGKAIVSTPYLHAKELLADNHGILVPVNDSAAIAHEIVELLRNPERLRTLQMRAYQRGRTTLWPVFAEQSLKLIAETCTATCVPCMAEPVGIKGLLRICDDTGILQHSIYDVPDRAHGYCLDDNARALILMNRLDTLAEPQKTTLTAIFAAFVQSAWNADRCNFRNFMGYSRVWLEDVGSEDSCGRAIWALGATALEGQSTGLRLWASDLFAKTAKSAFDFGSPRAIAFAMLGADYILASDSNSAVARRIITHGADVLLRLFASARRPDWTWFENMLAYDNARISEAMIRAGKYLGKPEITACGIETLEWICTQQVAASGHFRPIGSESFGLEFTAPMPFDQQPVEIWSLIDAFAAAYDATHDPVWIDRASTAYAWFAGKNDRGLIVADPESGTCRDGINPRGLNLNQGAESVLAYQIATCSMMQLLRRQK